ncbi:MAG: succinate dehydrogenase/fumarate reductase iron-sulfur subunit [Thermoplasmatota archaeon]
MSAPPADSKAASAATTKKASRVQEGKEERATEDSATSHVAAPAEPTLAAATARPLSIRLWRGDRDKGAFVDFTIPREEGMVVLDAVHRVQHEQATDLAVRWNCKAGKCGSCSAEINGKPRLMCMTRVSEFDPHEAITVAPLKTFPIIKDLVTDVSWNYRVNQRIAPFHPATLTKEEREKGELRMMQEDVDRVQEFRKCIECYLCQNVCHVLRDAREHAMFSGPRFLIRIASLEMHPRDGVDRVPFTKNDAGIGLCNITKCCTEVCPEGIHITDNGIIPMKERVADRFYDPVQIAWRAIAGRDHKKPPPSHL